MTEQLLKTEAIRLLRNDLYEHLENAEYLAQPPVHWTPEQQDQAAEVIEQLVTVVRGMVIIHDADPADDGTHRCPTCGKPWPCETLTTAHRLIKDPDGELVRILNNARGFR